MGDRMTLQYNRHLSRRYDERDDRVDDDTMRDERVSRCQNSSSRKKGSTRSRGEKRRKRRTNDDNKDFLLDISPPSPGASRQDPPPNWLLPTRPCPPLPKR
ncbi:hypothetical protein Pcinc_024780 [Petrolisthes cinctipes]|uniref:Uncharacterized protein n=1 Tax=Petrolisthes cinctipes TaxID=88211 RepID=A0AAE1BXD4_PETCI|nr:hypothetical protein Pcinc_035012 [Petrolisthes cinctipes]KAK3869946.1 hypothetical protein Pcinc_024779 [Petrolisthes cinctipes]KAK3869947.1 hypothetical protein Pcinc_024780 [Petrolisthes cinctipes]